MTLIASKNLYFESIISYICLMYSWQLSEWPSFEFDDTTITPRIDIVRERLILLAKQVHGLPLGDRRTYLIEVLIDEAQNTSSIESEYFSREDLRASILTHLDPEFTPRNIKDWRALGIGKLTRLVASTFTVPLSENTLKYWHATMLQDNEYLNVIGDYRKSPNPMQIVSGPSYNLTVHYEAPPAINLAGEMQQFMSNLQRRRRLDGFNNSLLQAGLGHLHFESIHPFEDGNGRIGRAIIAHLLSEPFEMPVPFSVSRALQARQQDYYAALGSAQSSLDATNWLTFFLDIIIAAVDTAEKQIDFILNKAKLFDRVDQQINPRQRKALTRLAEAGPEGFQGGFSTKNYMRLTRTPKATASRDLSKLVELRALTRLGAGRSTRYELKLPAKPET